MYTQTMNDDDNKSTKSPIGTTMAISIAKKPESRAVKERKSRELIANTSEKSLQKYQ